MLLLSATSLLRGGFGGAPKKLSGVFWPNLVGAFKVVLPGKWSGETGRL